MRWWRVIWRPALLLAGLAAVGLLVRGTGFDVREAVAQSGRHGPLAFVAIGTLACAAAVPRQAVALVAGYAFGFWPGSLLALAAELGGCAIDFAWARLIGRAMARRVLERQAGGRLARLDRFLTAHAFTATLTLRLLPVGSNVLLNLAAGVSGVATAPFLAASLLGYVPQTAVFALAGAGASLSSGTQLALAASLLLLSIALGMLLLRRRRLPA